MDQKYPAARAEAQREQGEISRLLLQLSSEISALEGCTDSLETVVAPVMRSAAIGVGKCTSLGDQSAAQVSGIATSIGSELEALRRRIADVCGQLASLKNRIEL